MHVASPDDCSDFFNVGYPPEKAAAAAAEKEADPQDTPDSESDSYVPQGHA